MNRLIYFSAPWCGPCKMFGPIMDKVSASGIPVEKVNVDSAPATASAYNVRSVPTTILVDSQGEELKRVVGAVSEAEVRKLYGQV